MSKLGLIDKPVVILGAGGHSKVLIDTLRQQGVDIIAVTDQNTERWGSLWCSVPIIGDDAVIKKSYPPESIYLVNGLGSVCVQSARTHLFKRFKQAGYYFASVIHPSVQLAQDIQLGEGIQCLAGVILQAGTSIGDNVILNTGTIVDHDCHIESHTHLAPRVVLSGGVCVGAETHIGTGAVVIQGITIGNQVTIGAGAVVIRTVADQCKVVGVPARLV